MKPLSFCLLLCLSPIAAIPLVPAFSLQAAEIDRVNNDRQLVDRGLAAFEQSNYSRAVEYWEQQRDRGIKRRNIERQIDTIDLESLGYLALGYQKLGNSAMAQSTIAQGKDLMSNASNQLQAKLLNISGSINLDRDMYADADKDWQQASKLYRSQKDKLGEVGSQINRAISLQKLGKYQQSLNLLDRQQSIIDT